MISPNECVNYLDKYVKITMVNNRTWFTMIIGIKYDYVIGFSDKEYKYFFAKIKHIEEMTIEEKRRFQAKYVI